MTPRTAATPLMISFATRFSSTYCTWPHVENFWASSPLLHEALSRSRFAPHEEGHDGGPPPIRTRLNIRGILSCPPKYRRALKEANLLVDRTCAILTAATEAGITEWALENPCDRAYRSHTAGAVTYLLTRGTDPYGKCQPSSNSPGLPLAIWLRFPCVTSLPIGKSIPASSSRRAFSVSSSLMGSCAHTSPTTREQAAPSITASGIPPRRQHTHTLASSTYIVGAGLLSHLSDDSNRNDYHVHSPRRTQVCEPANPNGTTTAAPLPAAASAQAAGHRVHGAPAMTHPAATPRPETATSERPHNTSMPRAAETRMGGG